MQDSLTEDELDDLIGRLKQCVASMKEEAQNTRYPDRAEKLPEMTQRLNEAIAHLQARRVA